SGQCHLIGPALGARSPLQHERGIHVDALFDHVVDNRRKQLRVHGGLRCRDGRTRGLASRVARGIVSMWFMPMSTAFLMFCVWPSTFNPAALPSSITARNWSSVIVRSTLMWSTPAFARLRT